MKNTTLLFCKKIPITKKSLKRRFNYKSNIGALHLFNLSLLIFYKYFGAPHLLCRKSSRAAKYL